MAKNNYWTIDGVDDQFNTLWRAKAEIKTASLERWREIMKATKGMCAIRHWVKGNEVSIVIVQGQLHFTRAASVEEAKKYGFYIPVQ